MGGLRTFTASRPLILLRVSLFVVNKNFPSQRVGLNRPASISCGCSERPVSAQGRYPARSRRRCSLGKKSSVQRIFLAGQPAPRRHQADLTAQSAGLSYFVVTPEAEPQQRFSTAVPLLQPSHWISNPLETALIPPAKCDFLPSKARAALTPLGQAALFCFRYKTKAGLIASKGTQSKKCTIIFLI